METVAGLKAERVKWIREFGDATLEYEAACAERHKVVRQRCRDGDFNCTHGPTEGLCDCHIKATMMCTMGEDCKTPKLCEEIRKRSLPMHAALVRVQHLNDAIYAAVDSCGVSEK